MVLQTILGLIILNIMRKTAAKAGESAQWKSIIIGMMLLMAGLTTLSFSVKQSRTLSEWLGYGALAALYYLVFTKKDFFTIRPLMFAFLPIIGLNFIEEIAKLINRTLYNQWDNYFEIAELFALVWMIAMLIINGRQKKALEKQRQINEEKEKEIRITQKLKAELEVQVQQRTLELTKQKEELEHALDELKATQAQLVQSEKMASLGELTAGIAHEIQNPLNFVNNFSEVSNELLDEMKEEIAKGNYDEVTEIITDVQQNLEKINHHGKRADAIVKGMLQHSRSSNGQKEPTDINALSDEYLRLSYHGLRAKDKSFNAIIKTEFDTSIGKINITPQDIGRVIMNLLTNAFYAVNARKNLHGFETYEPTVTVKTSATPLFPNSAGQMGGRRGVSISVSDNGGGIPAAILDKIFQPFFTTKPTGEGTGLGLSMSYDIVTKAHGGELKVKTDGEGTTFTIQLPLA